MSDEAVLLQRRFSELLHWEKSKRREKILVAALSYSLLLSLLVLPARGLLPPSISPLCFPLLVFLLLAPALFLLRPWGKKESLRALFALDQTLRLEERAMTAWEILAHENRSAAEQYVLHEAGERLGHVDLRALFKRQWSWHALAALPLLLLWFVLTWLDVGIDFSADAKRSKPASAAQRLKEFSEELRQKAEAEGLAETLNVSKALQRLAEERLRGKESEQKFGENLAAMQKQIEEKIPAAGEGDPGVSAYTRDALSALKAELEAFKGPLRPNPALGEKEILDKLAALPRLSEAMEKSRRPSAKLYAQELQDLLDKLERDVASELDRRSLREAQEFLAFLLRGGDAGEVLGEALAGNAQRDREGPPPAEKVGGEGNLPGDQPGAKTALSQPPPFSAGAAKHLRGVLGEGKSAGLTWRGEAKAGESKASEQDVVATYRRQAEEELASEKIPQGLKEAVKKYFLSLGMTEEKK